jgi:hypothetical protein
MVNGDAGGVEHGALQKQTGKRRAGSEQSLLFWGCQNSTKALIGLIGHNLIPLFH